MSFTIDITPTWVAILPILLAAIEDGTKEGRAIAKDELKRLASIADRQNEIMKQTNVLVAGEKHPVGTRHSNSEWYDAATDEVVHGFQVFEQFSPDGKPTGRKSFIDHRGNLCSMEIAEQKRADALKDTAPELLAAIRAILFQVVQGKVLERDACVNQARAAYIKAAGISS